MVIEDEVAVEAGTEIEGETGTVITTGIGIGIGGGLEREEGTEVEVEVEAGITVHYFLFSIRYSPYLNLY